MQMLDLQKSFEKTPRLRHIGEKSGRRRNENLQKKRMHSYYQTIAAGREARLYELLGIRPFRKLLFRLETFRHRRHGGRNDNYHLRDVSAASMRAYSGYLLYNTLIHCMSLFFALVYLLITLLSGRHLPVLSLLMGVLAIFNLYCIMLQRYTGLRLGALYLRRCERMQKQGERIRQMMLAGLKSRSTEELSEEAALLKRMETEASQGKDCRISDEDALRLRRIFSGFKVFSRKKGSNPENVRHNSMVQVIGEYAQSPLVISEEERRTSRLQKVLRREKQSNVLFGFTVITETETGEEAYRSVFPIDSRDAFETLLSAAIGAYEQALVGGEGAGQGR